MVKSELTIGGFNSPPFFWTSKFALVVLRNALSCLEIQIRDVWFIPMYEDSTVKLFITWFPLCPSSSFARCKVFFWKRKCVLTYLLTTSPSLTSYLVTTPGKVLLLHLNFWMQPNKKHKTSDAVAYLLPVAIALSME
jgi:hypothetical protein